MSVDQMTIRRKTERQQMNENISHTNPVQHHQQLRGDRSLFVVSDMEEYINLLLVPALTNH